MDTLPTELLLHILSHLDVPPPSVTRFSHEPSILLTTSKSIPLKSLRLTSHRFHALTTPILFQNCVLSLDRALLLLPIDARTLDAMQAALKTLSPHELAVYISMRAKLDATQPGAYQEEFDTVMLEFVDVKPGDKWMEQSGRASWVPRLPPQFREMEKFLRDHNLRHKVDSLVVVAQRDYEPDFGYSTNTVDGRMYTYHAVQDLWKSVFTLLNPERVVVAAPPGTLATLTETSTLSSDGWAFEMFCHYLELRQDRPKKLESEMKAEELALQRPDGYVLGTGPVTGDRSSLLIYARPWTHIGYNEGNSVPVYSTYEYHLKQTPKVLYLVLARLGKETCCYVRSLTFVAIFPFSSHMRTMLRSMRKVPTLKQLRVQLAPGKENNILTDRIRMRKAQRGDLWMELDGCYSKIAEFLWSMGQGAEFRSDDGSIGCGGKSFQGSMKKMGDLHNLENPEEVVEWNENGAGRWKRIDALNEATKG
ncbi:uncharacterized protein BDZ99DRAFT_461210 [Mytilinidion resinicola]|uniref:F-box domain-containing protein n=1 Tax=Mytilinidion resinicola TaxID=574789 RepID=A0A6A6YUU9_9PEZI|nr:uncharacterized protein BDZ99DRAFT_461210 [Mytilinidion resinicola]KAF2812540.1 hypothetical protein BDZ99DRAFT_461210 [Mytilinidion resinicola]